MGPGVLVACRRPLGQIYSYSYSFPQIAKRVALLYLYKGLSRADHRAASMRRRPTPRCPPSPAHPPTLTRPTHIVRRARYSWKAARRQPQAR